MLEGARRVGKSTIVKQFAQHEYKSFIFVDFNEEGEGIKELFKGGFRNLDDFFRALSTYYHVDLYPREFLIVFDEIQKFPRAHEGMKYFVKDGRYDFIETGSLITLKLLNNKFIIPSEVEYLSMYPMDFEEFLMALGDTTTISQLQYHFDNKKPLGDVINRRMMNLYMTYLRVGGMPQAIEQFLKDNVNLSKVDKVKREIIKLYEDDLKNYDNKYKTITSNIYSFIPAFLANKNKAVNFNKIKKHSDYLSLANSFDGLKKSMVGNICSNVLDPPIGLNLTVEPNNIKIYSQDTGLLITQILSNTDSTSTDIYKNCSLISFQ